MNMAADSRPRCSASYARPGPVATEFHTGGRRPRGEAARAREARPAGARRPAGRDRPLDRASRRPRRRMGHGLGASRSTAVASSARPEPEPGLRHRSVSGPGRRTMLAGSGRLGRARRPSGREPGGRYLRHRFARWRGDGHAEHRVAGREGTRSGTAAPSRGSADRRPSSDEPGPRLLVVGLLEVDIPRGRARTGSRCAARRLRGHSPENSIVPPMRTRSPSGVTPAWMSAKRMPCFGICWG